jgi:hypothetical protein
LHQPPVSGINGPCIRPCCLLNVLSCLVPGPPVLPGRVKPDTAGRVHFLVTVNRNRPNT